VAIADSVAPDSSLHVLDEAEIEAPDAKAPGVSTGTFGALRNHATEIAGGYYCVNGSHIEIWSSLQSTPAMKVVRQAKIAGDVKDLPALGAALAKALGFPAAQPATNSVAALRAYADALDAATPEENFSGLVKAATIDPHFGAAYSTWAQKAAAARNIALLDRASQLAMQQGGAISPLVQARIASLVAQAHGDVQARIAAFGKLAKLDPANPNTWRSLAETEFSAGKPREAIQNYERAAQLVPAESDVRNQLAYAYMALGDEANAMAQIVKYQQLSLEPGNAFDSLGDIQFGFNHFADAGKSYVQAVQSSTTSEQSLSMAKAAACELMRGDLQKADALHDEFVKMRVARQDALAALFQADWFFETGRRAKAIEIATKYMGLPIPAAFQSLARTRLAAWQLQMGNREAARQLALTSQDDGMTRVVKLISSPLDDTSFTARAAELFPGPANQPSRLEAQGYRLLFDRNFAAAEPVWKQISQQSSDHAFDVIYAWTLVENHKPQEAARLVRVSPLWRENTTATFTSFWFPRLFAVRAATSAGTEAERNRKLYQMLGGT
jgi:tetratricopeptide (TPR) repeat protein